VLGGGEKSALLHQTVSGRQCRRGRYQQRHQPTSLGDFDPPARLCLIQVAAGVLAQLSNTYSRHSRTVAPLVLLTGLPVFDTGHPLLDVTDVADALDRLDRG